MKKKFSYKDVLYKSKRIAVLGLIVVFGAGIMVTSGLDKKSELPAHDGEVLVDSLAVSEENEAGSKEDGKSETASAEKGDFEEMRARLTLDRNKLIATLDSTISDSKNDNERKNASEEKQRIIDYMETELAIESIIEQKNLPDSFVLITESSISVTVDKQELDTGTVAKICDIAMRETGKSADKIIIQSKY